MFRIRTVLAGAAVAAAAILAVAAPASAHDRLVSSSPAADEQLTAAPEQLVLTFSNQLIALEGDSSGTAVVVADESGRDWAADVPVVVGETVTVPLGAGMPNGAYQVTWKVVSSDGHPTSGEYAFQVAAPEQSAAPEESVTPGAEPSDEPTAVAEPTAEPAEDEGGLSAPLLIGAGIAVAAGVVAVVVIAARRRR